MAEYISREAAEQVICEACERPGCPRLFGEDDCDSIKRLNAIPTTDVRPVLRGEWKKRMEEKETPYYKSFTPIWSCSECGTEYDPSFCVTINFCPNCGADMAANDRHYGKEGSDHG